MPTAAQVRVQRPSAPDSSHPRHHMQAGDREQSGQGDNPPRRSGWLRTMRLIGRSIHKASSGTGLGPVGRNRVGSPKKMPPRCI